MSYVRSFHCLVLSVSAAFLFALASFSPASAGTVTVQSTADGAANAANCPGASCRLRDAIAAAVAGDTIDFNLPSPSTITLTSGSLTINKNLTITGPGATSLTISGNHISGVFFVVTGTVNISGLTITAGNETQGGGIANTGTLTLTNVAVSGNSATQGGGIYNVGFLTVSNSTLSGNSATQGGGIFNYNLATLTNVTLSGNPASSNGGGIFNGAGATLINATLSGNSAGTSGGGIYNTGGIMSMKNTIVANSPSGGNCAGTTAFTSLGHNLEYPGPTTCNLTAGGDIVGLDPQLSALTLNAPGTTETMALSSTSPAIDAGDNANLPPTDQRGAFRIWDGDGNGSAIVDIGAYEYGAPVYVFSVPAMNEWGMIVFILHAGFASVYYLKKRRRAEG